jgi:hypothetical protein
MARLGAGALQLFATLVAVALAARGAAAVVPRPSIMLTGDGGVISVTLYELSMPHAAARAVCTCLREHGKVQRVGHFIVSKFWMPSGLQQFTSVHNITDIVGVDVLSANTPFTANLLGSYADSKCAPVAHSLPWLSGLVLTCLMHMLHASCMLHVANLLPMDCIALGACLWHISCALISLTACAVALTLALTDTRYRLFVTDLTPADKPKVSAQRRPAACMGATPSHFQRLIPTLPSDLTRARPSERASLCARVQSASRLAPEPVPDTHRLHKVQVLGDLLLPNGAYKADRCPEPIHKLLTVIKSGSGAHLILSAGRAMAHDCVPGACAPAAAASRVRPVADREQYDCTPCAMLHSAPAACTCLPW